MPHPPAPWTLKGHALQTVNLIDVDRARLQIPAELTIVSIFPGKTLGGIYIANYESGSTLEYSELIVVAGLVSYAGKIAPWISHIYVDNPDSVAGGREIWGLPKELAEFSWQMGDQPEVAVYQEKQPLCSVRYRRSFSLWQQTLFGTSFSRLNSDLLLFEAHADLRPGLTIATLDIPQTSPFSRLRLEQPWLSLTAEAMQLTVKAPSKIGQMERDRQSLY